ncbi:unnamed protein product, partial [Effrenium voratum]
SRGPTKERSFAPRVAERAMHGPMPPLAGRFRGCDVCFERLRRAEGARALLRLPDAHHGRPARATTLFGEEAAAAPRHGPLAPQVPVPPLAPPEAPGGSGSRGFRGEAGLAGGGDDRGAGGG